MTHAFRRELERKAIHVAGVIVPLALAAGVARRIVAATLLTLVAGALLVELGRRRSRWIDARFTAAFSPLLREREHHDLTGATWLLASMLIAVVALPRGAAIAATWAAVIGDAAAALVGMRIGRHRSSHDGKSLEGSAACFLATLIGMFLVARLTPGIALLAAAVATIAERLPWPSDDNARIVTLVGATVMAAAMLRY